MEFKYLNNLTLSKHFSAEQLRESYSKIITTPKLGKQSSIEKGFSRATKALFDQNSEEFKREDPTSFNKDRNSAFTWGVDNDESPQIDGNRETETKQY